MNPNCFSAEVRQFLEDERNFLAKLFRKEQYECIIEVGCHIGHNAHWLSQLCTQYIGVDINKEAIELARKSKQIPGKIEFFCAAVEDLNFLLLSDEKYPKKEGCTLPLQSFW